MLQTRTSSVVSQIRSELPELLKLAGPVVLAELGWMLMGVADTIMVGRISAAAIGAVAIGNVIFNCIGLMSIGFLLGLDTLVAQAFGAGDVEDCNHSLRQGLWLAALIGPALLLVMFAAAPAMGWIGLHPEVDVLARPYTNTLAWSVLPLAVYAAFRRYLQSMNVVRPVMFALLSANVINILGNWVLIHGHLGFPAMGVNGSAWATVCARLYMAVFLAAVLIIRERQEAIGLFRWEGPDWRRIAMLLRLGIPAAGQVFLEIAVFAAATALAGRFPPAVLAAHEVALNNAALTFMVPLGISSAAAVRVGQAIGRKDHDAARIAGWTAILVGVGFMGFAGLVMLLLPREILGIYTPDRAVIEIGVPLLYAAAAFQLFDGTQVVSIGALRGLGDTKTPFLANIVGYWILGLPIGAWLCFGAGWGVLGLWVGLALGLMTVAIVLIRKWRVSLEST